MAPHDISLPNAKLHLSNLAAPMKARNLPFVIELRCLQKGSPPRSWRVDPYNEQMIDSALEAVSRLNSDGYNIYTTVNPICTGGEIWKASSDEEVIAATYLFLDADEEGVAKNIIEKHEVPYDFLVVTGTEPYLRAHFYLQLEAPTERISDWRLVMDAMITAHSCDKSAKNPSRVMRLAGLLTHPDPGKIEKNTSAKSSKYTAEIKNMVSFDSFFEKYVGVAETSPSETLNLNLVPPKPAIFDREEAKLKSQLPHEWHYNVLRLVASYVREGKSDEEIHAITDELTCNGYTIHKTRSDVQNMIESARRKFTNPKPFEPECGKYTPFFQKLSDIELKPIEYLIEDLIPKKALVEMFGQSGCGKSFLGVDIACSIATGKSYHELKTEKGATVYLAGEGHRGITQRGRAWFKYHGLLIGDAPIFISKHGLGLRDTHQLEFIETELDHLTSNGHKPSLIIIDTLARNFGGGDENSTKDMSEFIVAVDKLINRYDASVLLIHHSGHSDQSRGRGNSALKAAVDAEYRITKSDRFLYLNCTKMKDSEEIEEIRFFLDDILIQTSDGNHINTVVPIRRSQQIDRYRMTKKDADDLKKFREAYIELHGEYNTDEPISLTLEEWRPIYYRTHHGDNKEAKRKAFERTRKALLKKEILNVSNDEYTFTPNATGRVRDIIKTELSAGRTDTDTPL